MAIMLMKSYARVNWKDIRGRTALMYAVESNNKDLVRFLLCFRASPFFCLGQGNPAGKHAIDTCTDFDMMMQLKKAMWLRLGLLFYSDIGKRNKFWEYEALRYFDPGNDLNMPKEFKFC